MSLEDVDLEAGILSDLQKLAAKFHLKELIIFGSRADGTASDVSDVDLAVKGYGSPMVRADFEEAVKNLPVLLMFDIVDYESLREPHTEGCHFYEYCSKACDQCKHEMPELNLCDNRAVACFLTK